MRTDPSPSAVNWSTVASPATHGATLGKGDLLVVVATPASVGAALSPASCLSDDERRRADAMSFPAARERFVAARALMRDFAGRMLGVPPPEVPVHIDTHGKPVLGAAKQDLHFSISHAASLVAVAFSRDGAVGIDLEQPRAVRHASEVIRRLLSPAELPSAEAFAADQRLFFGLWTRKEAAVKLLGGQLLVDAPRFSVTDGGGWQSLVAIPGAPGGTMYTTIRPLEPPGFPDYVGAVATSLPFETLTGIQVAP